MTDSRTPDSASLRHYVQIVARRKWVVVQAIVLVTAIAFAFSLRQQKLYQGCAEVLLGHQNLVAALTGAQDSSAFLPADRVAQTQAELARVPAVAQRVFKVVKAPGRSPEFLLAHSTVTAKTDADLLSFCVSDPDQALASRFATEYARQFTVYRRQLDTTALEQARAEVQTRVDQIEASGQSTSPLLASLLNKEQQLRTMEALQGANVFLVRSASDAIKIQPKPVRNALLGFGIGIVLGLGLAFLWEALDTRVRSADEVIERLRMPLLARLPEPPRRLRGEDRLAMLDAPEGIQAEGFRMLRTNVEFANLERGARTIMVTSALEGEGKSTTVANLAVALARSGRHVVLLDLDLRRPYLDRFFGLQDRPGLTHVALGRATLDEALLSVAIVDHGRRGAEAAGGNGSAGVEGVLQVLAAGPPPPDTGEFVAGRKLAEILEQLEDRADIVLIDAPPLLQVGDALALSARVDALIVVTRLRVARRPMLKELDRVLTSCPSAKLGFVLTGADFEHGYGYGSHYFKEYGVRERESVS